MSDKLKICILISILVLNQWFAASAMACHQHAVGHTMEMASPTTAQPMAMQHVMTHDMNITTADAEHSSQQNSQMDCCDTDCSCPMSACSGLALLSLNATPFNLDPLYLPVNYQFSSLTVLPSLLAKPPQFS